MDWYLQMNKYVMNVQMEDETMAGPSYDRARIPLEQLQMKYDTKMNDEVMVGEAMTRQGHCPPMSKCPQVMAPLTVAALEMIKQEMRRWLAVAWIGTCSCSR